MRTSFLLIACGLPGSWKTETTEEISKIKGYPLLRSDLIRLEVLKGEDIFDEKVASNNDPNRTSLVSITPDLDEQAEIIKEYMLEYIDGIECWHSRNDMKTTTHNIEFAKKHGLSMTGGSDCHQKPLLLGIPDIPDYVAEQFIEEGSFRGIKPL